MKIRGGDWVALRGPGPTSPHRLSLVALDGDVRIPQRFAVDRALLGPDGMLVAEGDQVAAGQPLARIGNSGNSLGLHLHFHVGTSLEPLGGEGLPFALRGFELVGRIPSVPALLSGTAWRQRADQPARAVEAEMPMENMVVRFSQPGSGNPSSIAADRRSLSGVGAGWAIRPPAGPARRRDR